MALHPFDVRIEQPVLRHAEARKGRLFPPEIIPYGRRRDDFDDDVGRHANRFIELHVMAPRSLEERDIRLQHVVLVEDNVDRGYQGQAAVQFSVLPQPIVKFGPPRPWLNNGAVRSTTTSAPTAGSFKGEIRSFTIWNQALSEARARGCAVSKKVDGLRPSTVNPESDRRPGPEAKRRS